MASALAHLERMDEAAAAIARLLELVPNLTVSGLRKRWPLRNKDRLEMILDGLRRAGLPE
jgi:adenylate cyclase